MNRLCLVAALALAACSRRPAEDPTVAPTATVPPARDASADVARLAGDRVALDDAHARCKVHAPGATPELCAAAAEATRRRFAGNAGAYAPAPVAAFAPERR